MDDWLALQGAKYEMLVLVDAMREAASMLDRGQPQEHVSDFLKIMAENVPGEQSGVRLPACNRF